MTSAAHETVDPASLQANTRRRHASNGKRRLGAGGVEAELPRAVATALHGMRR